MAPEYGPEDAVRAVTWFGGPFLAFTLFTFGLAESLPTVATIGGVLGAFTGAIFLGRALKRRRNRKAETEWATEVQQIVRTERVAEVGHTAGGLSVPTEMGDAGGLSVSTGAERPDQLGVAAADADDATRPERALSDRLDRLRARQPHGSARSTTRSSAVSQDDRSA